MLELANTKCGKKKHKERAQEYYEYKRIAQKLYERSKQNENFYDLMDLVKSKENIAQAYRSIKRNKGAKTPGVDHKTIKDFERMKFDDMVYLVRKELDDYIPRAVKRKMIPKKTPGEFRPLGIPCFLDKLIQQCIKQILEPIMEAKFQINAYGFRPHRSAHQAIAHINSAINTQKYTHAVEFDIRKYFDNINHGILIEIIHRQGIKDSKLLQIMEAILKAPIKGEGIPTKGTPQGGVLSPILANIYLNELDIYMRDQFINLPDKFKKNKKKYKTKPVTMVRYADDFVIFTKSRKHAQYYMEKIIKWLAMFKLEHAPEKTHIRNLKRKAINFLGFVIKAAGSRDHKVKHLVSKSYIPKEHLNKIITKIKQVKDKNKKRVILQGYINYIAAATGLNKAVSYLNQQMYIRRINKEISKNKNHPKYCNRQNFVDDSMNIINVHFKIARISSENQYYINLQNLREFSGFRYLLEDQHNDSSEKYDISRSLWAAQHGKDPITKEQLIHPHCHRKIPGKYKGKYEYNNCVMLQKDTHQAIHGTQERMQQFCKEKRLRPKKIKKIALLWIKAHVAP